MTKLFFPKTCAYRNFFGCKRPKECINCFHNPDKRPTEGPWFYDDPEFVKECLDRLEDIRLGKGLRKGGKRFHWKYAKKEKEEE